MKKILIVLGTRPEAIKMAPLIFEFLLHKGQFEVKLCITGQHREMLDQVLTFFNLRPHYDLNLMKSGQSLSQLTADILIEMKPVLEDFSPDYVFVHGDTTTSSMAALAAFYHGSKVCHVEAGLRTNNKKSPFPEEINRQITARIADIHFAPTREAENNLINEGISKNAIYVVGNTVVDALMFTKDKIRDIADEDIERLKLLIEPSKTLLLVTGHRRENIGEGFVKVCQALKMINNDLPVQIIYPVHLNPSVKTQAHEHLENEKNIFLIPPLAYPAFVWLMDKANIIITDSGGIQEEALTLGKSVLLTRETTERPEAIHAGSVILVGTDAQRIVKEIKRILNEQDRDSEMSVMNNPYGDGNASKYIVEFMLKTDL